MPALPMSFEIQGHPAKTHMNSRGQRSMPMHMHTQCLVVLPGCSFVDGIKARPLNGVFVLCASALLGPKRPVIIKLDVASARQ